MIPVSAAPPPTSRAGGPAAPATVRSDGGYEHPSVLQGVPGPRKHRLRRLLGTPLLGVPSARASLDRVGRCVVPPHRQGRGVFVLAKTGHAAPFPSGSEVPV